ncbi:hypothetical protein Scep_010847 [Stephania cephalantha]|uniref:Uncharacterized protein n=1 Tax=Stephania cephalantha TaxID=152367 RepID=A0AAP0JW48_9MAGN
MARHGCINGTLDDSKYSSPIPIIGLYIAIATLVCFFSILFDVISGFRNRNRWLPCRFFSLNSVTLTLLAIAAKIPVDLMTKMPSAHDQLSKLTGTALICICMGFMMPSLGINRGSENWSNVLALSILVVTVVVNICIQLHTGVIILFRAEHIIMLCCMMLLLLAYFAATYDMNSQKGITVDLNKDRFKKGEGSMLQRLKLCYLHAYHSNPQIELCKDLDSASTGIICIVSSVVLLQAAVRCFIKKNLMFPCNGLSDYEWSTWIIVGTQIATILIGSIGTCFRFFTLVHHMKPESFGLSWADQDIDVINGNPLLAISLKDAFVVLIYLLYVVFFCVNLLIAFTCIVVSAIWEICSEERNMDEIEEFSHLIHEGEQGLEGWILRNCVADMKRWMELNKNDSPNHNTKQLLSKYSSLDANLKDLANANKAYEASSLSMVLLTKIATVCSDSAFGASLTTVYSETYEVIHFVERKMRFTSFENKKKYVLAKAAMEKPSSRDDLLKVFNISDTEASQLNVDIHQVIDVLGRMKEALPADLVQQELSIITDFIKRRNHRSIQELHDCIEHLFVDMLNEFLTQLPNAIYKEITESSPEDYEKAIRFSLKLLCKVESLEAFVHWSYPIGTNITNLITSGSNGELIDGKYTTQV